MGNKLDAFKIKSICITMSQHPSFTVKIKKSQQIANLTNYEFCFPLGTVNPVPKHISVKNHTKQGFDIFFDFNFITGSYSLKLNINNKECKMLSQNDLVEIYKMSYNRIQKDKEQIKSKVKKSNEFVSYLQTALAKRQNQNQ